jgi:hypothetical protein
LKSDGTVVVFGNNFSYRGHGYDDWRDINAIAAHGTRTLGLNKDGTVHMITHDIMGDDRDIRLSIKDWRDVTAIAVGNFHVVGLIKNGTVVVAGSNRDWQCEKARDWSDIIAICAASFHTVGLKSDGTIDVCGNFHRVNECKKSGWRDIVAIAAGVNHTVGLKSDGTVVAVGCNDNGQRDINGWRDIGPLQRAKRTTGQGTVGSASKESKLKEKIREDGRLVSQRVKAAVRKDDSNPEIAIAALPSAGVDTAVVKKAHTDIAPTSAEKSSQGPKIITNQEYREVIEKERATANRHVAISSLSALAFALGFLFLLY